MKKKIFIIVIFLVIIFSIGAFSDERKLASWYLLEGIKNYEQELYISAIINLKSALHLNPNFMPAYKYLGLAYSKMYLWEQAAREYNKIILINPAGIDKGEILAKIKEWEGKQEYLTATAQYTYYLLKYKHSVWEEPYNLLNYLALAEIYECERDYEKTEEFYRFLANENPGKEIFNLYLAETLALSDKIVEAERIYVDVLHNEPLNMEAILGLNYLLKKRFEIKLWSNPDDLYARVGLARVLRNLRRYDEAIAEYKLALDDDIYNANVRMELAEIYTYIGNYDEAIEQYELINKYDPKEIKSIFMIAQINESRGDVGAAKKAYDKILSIDPRNMIAKSQLERLRSSNKLAFNALNDKEEGRSNFKNYNLYGGGGALYVPFDVTSRLIYGYTKLSLNAGNISDNLDAYMIGFEKDLPQNYRIYSRFVHLLYHRKNKISGNFNVGVSRVFRDGSYFILSTEKQDLIDNENTINEKLMVDSLNFSSYQSLSHVLGLGIDGKYLNYSDINSGIDVKLTLLYDIILYPQNLVFIINHRIYNTANVDNRLYWAPKNYDETGIGLSWKYSFDKKNYYLVEFINGMDSDGKEMSESSFELGHNLDDKLSVKVKGDFHRSEVYDLEQYTYFLSFVI